MKPGVAVGAVCKMEGNMGHDAAAQQAALPINKDPSAQASIPASSPRLAFVYGTLKRGFGNHWLMEELMAGSHARFLGFACTKQHFPLVCGPFQVPFLLSSPSPSGHHVCGELYQVDSLAISRLDDLEGVTKGHYERRPIDIFLVTESPKNGLSGCPLHRCRVKPIGRQSPDADALTHHKDLETGMHTHQNLMQSDMHTHQSDMHAHQSDMHRHQINGDTDPSYLDFDTSSCCIFAGPLTSCRLYMDPPYLDEVDTSLSSTLASQSSGPAEYLHAEAYFACPSYGLKMADRAPHIPCYTEKEASTYVRRKDRPHGRTFLEHIHAWIEENDLIYT